MASVLGLGMCTGSFFVSKKHCSCCLLTYKLSHWSVLAHDCCCCYCRRSKLAAF